MDVAVLDVQGDVNEHLQTLKRLGDNVNPVPVKTAEKLRVCEGLIIPGGESTTVSKLMNIYGLTEAVKKFAKTKPVFGTCAGLVLLAKQGQNLAKGQSLLNLADCVVSRNAYGTQKDSFEADLEIPELGPEPYPGVFIRAPAIERVYGRCKSLCTYQGKTVFARQENLLLSAFHPELTQDLRVHKYFLEMI